MRRQAEAEQRRTHRREQRAERDRHRAHRREQHRAEAEQRRAHTREQRDADKRKRAEDKDHNRCSRQKTKQRLKARTQLRALICSALQTARSSWQKWLRQTWKVEELPDGVQLAKLRFEHDCACSVLTLQDGSSRHGPLRKSIREAETDLADLRALQRSKGDAAACTELEARDVQAMTAFFTSRLDQRGRR